MANKVIDRMVDNCGQSPTMVVQELRMEFHNPRAPESVTGSDGYELAQRLPPRSPRPAFEVQRYPACPQVWDRGGPNKGSFFVPVRDGKGAWLDFNGNSSYGWDLAVVISVQGICAVTGQHIQGEPRLEQYDVECPKHRQPFGADRFCQVCGYKWPKQNYLSSRATPSGLFWIDGFRTAEGEVRQLVFTSETERGIAAQLIGEQRSQDIKVWIFRSREPRPEPKRRFRSAGDYGGMPLSLSAAPAVTRSASPRLRRSASAAPKRLEVAAGAKIRQRIYPDTVMLDHYEDAPTATFVINYLDQRQVVMILAEGEADLTAGGEGPLSGLKVGQ